MLPHNSEFDLVHVRRRMEERNRAAERERLRNLVMAQHSGPSPVARLRAFLSRLRTLRRRPLAGPQAGPVSLRRSTVPTPVMRPQPEMMLALLDKHSVLAGASASERLRTGERPVALG